MLAKVAVILGAGLGAGFGAADAVAASLSVKVSPATVHPGGRYVVTISGSYSHRRRAPYLLAFIQYGGTACKSTATAEYALPTSRWSWDFYPQRAETTSPFKTVTYWKAGSRLGGRLICTYLYASQVNTGTMARPIARASTSFRNVRR